MATKKPTIAPLTHSPDSAALRLSVPTRTIYTLIANGDLRSMKVGKRRLIPDTELHHFMERELAKAGAA